MSKTRILLAEDHAAMAELLQDILETDFEIVGKVGDGRSLVEAARNLEPEIIIADVSMPLLNGLDAAQEVKKAGSCAKIIFLTQHGYVPLARKAFRAGASAYLLKQSAAKELITAIREVTKGNCYVTPLITNNPAAFFEDSEDRVEQ